MKVIGKFTVESGKLVVSDPCYERGTWCQGVIANVMNGTWTAAVEQEKGIIVELLAGLNLGDFEAVRGNPKRFAALKYEKEPFEVGVDSGQAGIFDESFYPVGETIDFEGTGSFYDACGDATLRSELGAGVVKNRGVVSSSGHGDGSYVCYTRRNAPGEVIGVRVVFLPEATK